MTSTNKYLEPMQPWPDLSPFSEKINLPINDLTLFAFVAGNKENPALLMIHGLGDEADTWRHILLPLSEKYFVIAMDLPGFGRSDKPDRKYTPTFMINSIIKLMDAYQIQESILMGSSLGGILSHQIAVEHPERVEGLILIGGTLFRTEHMGDWRLNLMGIPLLGEWLYTRLRKDPDAAYESIRNVYYDLDNMPQKDRQFLYKRVNKRVWSDGQRRAFFSTLRELASSIRKKPNKPDDLLMKLRKPTLVIRGEYDQIFSKPSLDHIAQFQPGIATETIENAGHLPHQEKPERFVKVVSDWLENIN